MTILDKKKRKSIDERLALHKRLRDSFDGKKYSSQHCRLCNWASNGLTFEEAIRLNKEHEATHPEAAQIEATTIDPFELIASIHDHECKMELCTCKCGCQSGPFCTLVFGPLCSVCQVREMRGDSEHGELDTK